MLSIGEKVKTAGGEEFVIESQLGAGGEGVAFLAASSQCDETWVIKDYYDPSPMRERRAEELIKLRLHEKCRGLHAAPRDLIKGDNLLGIASPLVPGQPLGDFLVTTPTTLVESLGLAIGITAPLAELERQHIGHGDVHIRNVLADRFEDSEIVTAYWVDFCNYISPDLPCLMMNPEHYSAPELIEEFEAWGTVTPTLESDRFGLGLLLADVLFRKHPQHGCEPDETWRDVVARGIWPLDPALRRTNEADVLGTPVLAGNDELINLFRLAFSRDPFKRPSAETWHTSLKEALRAGVYECSHCGQGVMVDPARTVCPHPACPHPNTRLAIKREGGAVIPLDRPRQILGRSELGGSPTVSRRHLSIVRFGMETLLESIGHNGTYIWQSNGWAELKPGCPVSLETGDRLRVAGEEIDVVEIR